VKLSSRKKDRQRNTGETATGSNIQYGRSGIECLNFGYAEGMKDVIYIQVLHILSGDDIDLFIPLTIEREKFLKLIFLSVRQIMEITEYDISVLHDW
jgi:hypothetical protein